MVMADANRSVTDICFSSISFHVCVVSTHDIFAFCLVCASAALLLWLTVPTPPHTDTSPAQPCSDPRSTRCSSTSRQSGERHNSEQQQQHNDTNTQRTDGQRCALGRSLAQCAEPRPLPFACTHSRVNHRHRTQPETDCEHDGQCMFTVRAVQESRIATIVRSARLCPSVRPFALAPLAHRPLFRSFVLFFDVSALAMLRV